MTNRNIVVSRGKRIGTLPADPSIVYMALDGKAYLVGPSSFVSMGDYFVFMSRVREGKVRFKPSEVMSEDRQ